MASIGFPLQSTRLRWRNVARHRHGGPPLVHLMDVEAHPGGSFSTPIYRGIYWGTSPIASSRFSQKALTLYPPLLVPRGRAHRPPGPDHPERSPDGPVPPPHHLVKDPGRGFRTKLRRLSTHRPQGYGHAPGTLCRTFQWVP